MAPAMPQKSRRRRRRGSTPNCVEHEREHKDVVHAQAELDQVGGEVLLRRLGPPAQPDGAPEAQAQEDAGQRGGGVARADPPGCAFDPFLGGHARRRLRSGLALRAGCRLVERLAVALDADGHGHGDEEQRSARSPGRISPRPFPLSRMPRTIRRKWVRGRHVPIHWAHTGMPRKGNMKPDSRIDGRKKKNAICIAWSWFLARVENVIPMARFAAMKRSGDGVEQDEAADHRDTEQEAGRRRGSASPARSPRRCREGSCPTMTSKGLHGRREQVLHRSALPLARDRERRDDHHRHRQHDAHQAGHDVVLGDVLGVVVRVDLEIDGAGGSAQAGQGPRQVAVDRGVRDAPGRRRSRGPSPPGRSRRPRRARSGAPRAAHSG